jgi:hypothetical protein
MRAGRVPGATDTEFFDVAGDAAGAGSHAGRRGGPHELGGTRSRQHAAGWYRRPDEQIVSYRA